MVERVYNAQIPISWIVADTVYGNNLDLRDWLGEHGYWSVLAVACTERIGIRTSSGQRKQIRVHEVEASLIHAQSWQRLSMGDGTKGPRLFDWAWTSILHKWEDDGCHWLLIRRCIDNPKTKTYYIVFGPHDTTLQKMVTMIGYRWRIEDDFKSSKGIGLDHYEVRRWICWYRHITLVMLAHAFLAIICVESRNPPVVDAYSPDTPSSTSVLNSFPASLPNPHASSMIAVGSPSFAVFPDIPASVTALDSSTARVLPRIPAGLSSPPVLPRPPLAGSLLTSVLPVESSQPSSPVFSPAPLTIPEVRHLLGHLIWPASTSAPFVLAWSAWRRYHRSMSSYYHTKRRLDAG
jgi:hypothetical protein